MSNIGSCAAFAAGILAFFSPCVLPVLPVYIGLLAGSGSQGPVKAGGGCGKAR